MNKDVRLNPVVDGKMPIEEVFYADTHIGDVFQFEDEPTWYFRTKDNLMWWRATDKDQAIGELLRISGNSILR